MARNPTWTKEELILALDVYMEHRGHLPDKGTDVIRRLSEDINKVARTLGLVPGDERFRNEAGVYMKLMNFLALDPTYEGVGLRGGGRRDAEVWREYERDLGRLHSVAGTIRQSTSSESLPRGSIDEDEEFPEGRLITREHRRRERNSQLTQRKKQAAQQIGPLICEACGFDFAAVYGDLGSGFIECHHLIPVSEWEGERHSRVSDLALLCSNCHRMIHRVRPWASVAEFREVINS